MEELFKDGPRYEYEYVTIKVPVSRSRLSLSIGNDLDTSESQVDPRFYIKKIKVPVRRMRGSSP